MATRSAQVLEVSSEEQAFKYLESALRQELSNAPVVLSFKNWPKVTFKLEGKGYDSTITPDMAEALVELQHAMNRAYARLSHDTTNARSLKAEERRELRFKAKVEKGSSLVTVDLGKWAEKLATVVADKMTPEQVVITVLGLAVIGGSVLAYKAFLKHRSEDVKVERETASRLALSTEETKRLDILTKALASRPQLAYAQQDFDEVKREIVKSTGDAKTLTVQGVELSNSEAQRIAATPRTSSEDVQLNGHYSIQKIDWSEPGQVRLWLSNTDEPMSFVAALKGDALSSEQIERLKSAEWERKRLYMSINGTRLRGEVTSASIVRVEWPRS